MWFAPLKTKSSKIRQDYQGNLQFCSSQPQNHTESEPLNPIYRNTPPNKKCFLKTLRNLRPQKPRYRTPIHTYHTLYSSACNGASPSNKSSESQTRLSTKCVDMLGLNGNPYNSGFVCRVQSPQTRIEAPFMEPSNPTPFTCALSVGSYPNSVSLMPAEAPNIGASLIRIGFLGPLYINP